MSTICENCKDLLSLIEIDEVHAAELDNTFGELNWDIGDNDFDDIIKHHMFHKNSPFNRSANIDTRKAIKELLKSIEKGFDDYLRDEFDIDNDEDLAITKDQHVLIYSSRLGWKNNSGFKVVNLYQDEGNVRKSLLSVYSTIHLSETNYHRILFAMCSSHDVPTGSSVLIISFHPEI